jgi:hypothetical protein
VPGEEHLADRYQSHEQGRPVAVTELAQPGGHLRRNDHPMGGALGGLHRRARPVGRQFQRSQAVEPVAPVAQLPVECAVGLLPALPGGEIRVANGKFGQLDGPAVPRGTVEHAQLMGQHTHRPAVDDRVVHAQHQDVLQVSQSGQYNAEQRALAQVERAAHFLTQQPVQPLLAGLHSGHLKIAGCDHLAGTAGLRGGERGAQWLVPGDQTVARGAERVGVELAAQANADADVVLHGVRCELVGEPESLLCEGQRQLAAPRHRLDPVAIVHQGPGVDLGGQLGDRRHGEQRPGRQIDAQPGTDPGEHPDAEQ